MNKLILTTVIILNCYISFAGKNEIAIKGTITHPLADSVTFSYQGYGDNWLDYKDIEVSKHLDDRGNFLVTLSLQHNYTRITIQNGAQATEIFGSPGDKLLMSVDAADFDATLKYEGIGMQPTVANFMAKHVMKFGFMSSFHRKVNKMYGEEPEKFKKDLNALVQQHLDFLVEHSDGLPQSFIRFWNTEYEYTKYHKVLRYGPMHEVVKQQSYSITTIPKENYEIARSVPALFNDEYIEMMSYRQYIREYYGAQLSAAGVEDIASTGSYLKSDKQLELARQNMPRSSEEYVYAEYLYNYMEYLPIERIDYCYSIFTNRYPESSYTNMLYKAIEVKKKLNAGAPAIDFTVYNSDGEGVKISELKGKVVYVDFWASWCGPCKVQFPHVKKIKEHFEGKDLVFVYVSIDENEEAWKKAVEKYQLTGLHVNEKKGFNSPIAKAYDVRGVPSYFLIGRDGNFAIDGGETPEPIDTEELIKKIESLL